MIQTKFLTKILPFFFRNSLNFCSSWVKAEKFLKLMKEAFLLKTELGERFGYNFVPYDFGPCSFQIYEDLKELTNEGIVKEDKNKVFSVYTISSSYENTVMELIENLKPEVREAIFKIKKEFNELTYYALISYVYQKYPQWTRASKFRLS